MEHLITIVVAVATPVLLYLVRRGIAWLESEHKLKVSQESKVILDALVRDAIHYAEEQARKKANGIAGDKSKASQGKLDAAVGFIEAEAPEPVAAERAARLVEARLAAMRQGE